MYFKFKHILNDMTNKESVKKYREKIKADPELYAAYKARRRAEHDAWLKSIKEDPIKYAEYLAKEKIRSKLKRELRAKDPDKQKKENEYQKKYHTENKELVKAYPSRKSDYIKNINLYRRYGLTYEKYMLLLEHQNYSCAICNTQPDKKLVVDHDHQTGEVRALLCRSCNVALGFLKEDINILQNAITYINRYKK